MYLKRLELSGFKSFARPTTLEFNTPITAIVGPNGAGKSNIAEAVRFVLGEQSIKSLRGKRGEDLIFHGTKSVPRQNLATVAIVFDNKKKVFNIDYDEVELKRAVHRDSASEYFLNGSKTRLKDTIELLSSVHIGASSHHIISQGEADRILSASIKERREMIEDALGLKIYQYKRAESERKLDKTKENIGHVEALRREIAPHLEFLKKQLEKVKQADMLREELRTLYKKYIMGERKHLASQEDSILREKEVPQKELERVEKEIRAEEVASAAEGKTIKKSDELRTLEKGLEEVRVKKDEYSRTLGRLEGMFEYEDRKLKDAEEKRHDEKDITIPHAVVQEFKANADTLLTEADAAQEVATVKAILGRIREVFFLFTKKIAKDSGSEELYIKIKEEHERLKKEKRVAEEALQSAEGKEKELFVLYTNKRVEIEKETSEARTHERALFELRGRRTELTTRLELIRIREERVQEGKESFKIVCEEAAHHVGKDAITALLNEPPLTALPDYAEQEAMRRKIERLKIKLEDAGVGGSDIVKEYSEVKERDEFLAREVEDLLKSAESLRSLIEELGEKIDTEFKNGIKKINTEFQSLFSLVFGGGSASVTLIVPKKRKKSDELIEGGEDIDSFDAEPEEGVEIHVTHPHKRIKGLAMLSGGERALTSLALIFAIIQVNPPPFLILDETDAALDETNSRKYSGLLESLSKQTQLIIITHNRETMLHAGVLYGVTTASDGISRLLSVKLDEAVKIAE